MLKSMTGYGRGERAYPQKAYLVEIQAYNHRYFEFRARTPRHLARLEPHLQQEVHKRFSRGRFDLSLTERELGERPRNLVFNRSLAYQYYGALEELKGKLGLPGEVTLELLAGMKDLLTLEEVEEGIEEVWQQVRPALEEALDSLEAMRVQEGTALEAEIEGHLQHIAGLLRSIKERSPEVVRAYRTRLRARIQDLLGQSPVDPTRLEQEVATFADRSEITEECVRLESHLAQFHQLLAGPGPQGRKLDFLLQEMNREANTISAKAQDPLISQWVVELKAELEKIREQAQNVE